MKDYIYCGITKPTTDSIHKNFILVFKTIENGREERVYHGFDCEHDAKNADRLLKFILKNKITCL